MHVAISIITALIVPPAAIGAFILIDEGFTALAKRFSRSRDKNKKVGKVEKVEKVELVQLQTNEPTPVDVKPDPKPGCKKCAGCKLAATGGCRRKQNDLK